MSDPDEARTLFDQHADHIATTTQQQDQLRQLWNALIDHINDDGLIPASEPELADAASIPQRTVHRRIRVLLDSGLLRLVQEGRGRVGARYGVIDPGQPRQVSVPVDSAGSAPARQPSDPVEGDGPSAPALSTVVDTGALSGRVGRVEAAAAELDAHVGQAPAGAATQPPAVVSPQLLTGHTGPVWAVTSWQEESGRRLLASASTDGTVRIWDAADGRLVRRLEGHTDAVSAVTSWQEESGRRLLASASGDGTVRIWDAADGRPAGRLDGHTDAVSAVTSWQEESGRRMLASASMDRTVRIWDAADGRPAGTLEGHTDAVSAVTSWQEESGRRMLASASEDRTVRIWDAADGRPAGTLEGHTDAVSAVTSWQEESGQRLLASASFDETVRIWDAADGRLIQTLEGHTSSVSAVTSWQEESGQRLLASASMDRTVRIWDAADGRLIQTLEGHTSSVWAVTSWQEESGQRLLASTSMDQTVRLWTLPEAAAGLAGLPAVPGGRVAAGNDPGPVSAVSGEVFRTVRGFASAAGPAEAVVVYPDGVGAEVDPRGLSVVAQRQAVTDAETWAARASERTWDRSAAELLAGVQGRGGVWRVVLAFGDRGHEGVLDLVGRLLDGRLRGVDVPAAAVIELSPYGADPSVEPRTLVEVAALRLARGQSGAVAIRSRYVAGAAARSVPEGLIPVDFSGRDTFAGGALLWEFHARPISPEDARTAQFYREATGLHGVHAPYLLPTDGRWARFGQQAASYMRNWVFPPVPWSGLGRWRVVELRQAELLAGESVAGATPDVGPVGWVPDGARVLVLGVPRPHRAHPTAVVGTLFDTFLNSALPPVESGLREPVYVVVHGFGGRASPVVLAHVAEDDLWPVRMGEMVTGQPVVGTREVSNLVEAQSWTRVRLELRPIAAALQPGGAAEQWRARVPELTAMLPDVTVTDPVAVDLSDPDAAGTVGVRAHRRMGERVDQLIALGEELVRHTREWVGGAAETDRLDLRLEEWAGHRDSQQLVTAFARAGRLTDEVEGLVAEQIGRVWAAVVPPGIVLAGEGATVPDAVRDVLRAVYLGAWVLSTGPDGPVVVRGYAGRQRADLSRVRSGSGAEFTRFLAGHGGDVALLWSADGPADPGARVSRLRTALDVPLVPRQVDVVGRVPEVSEQRRAELFSAVSAFGVARELLEDQIRLLPVRAAVLPGQASVTAPPPEAAPSPHAGDAPVVYEWVAGPDGVVPGGGQSSAGGLPEWMYRGDRRGDGLLCLLDSLAQTLNGVRPGQYRGFDNVETRTGALLDRMEGWLGSDHVVIRDLRSGRGAEVYSGGFLNALAELFQVRVQVVEQGGDRRWYGHPVVGRDGDAPLMLVEFVSPGSGGGRGSADEEMGTFYPLFVDTVHAAALGGAATITDHLIQRWEALVGGHTARIDRLQAAERPLAGAADRGQDVSQARSVLDRLSRRYLDGLREFRLARGSGDLSEYVRSVSDIAALSGRIGRVEAAAAELDAHVGQAPAGAATQPPAVVSPQLLTGHTGPVWAVTS
ncbi:hypothetical protein V6U90_32360, partial [Micromonospora sp. CPCC 206060]